VGATSPALAQEHDWSGPYLGGHAGLVFGQWDHSTTISSPDGNDIGGDFGGHVGYNYQTGGNVLGVEADLSSLSLDNDFINFSNRHFKEEWQSTVRARYGIAVGNWLPYAAAGVAFTGVKASIDGVGDKTDTAVGLTGALGVDYALSSNWSARLEGTVTDVPSKNFTVGTTAMQLGSTNEAARLGVSYNLGDLLK
jgi:outer membrane immunogenic protein